MNYKILVLTIVAFSFFMNCSKDKTTEPKPDNIPSVKIGNQVWMSKNLDVDTYRNGDHIPEVTDQNEWANLTSGAWCYYDNDPANGKIYGKLYNWYAVNDPRCLSPDGWHIPTDEEWTVLTDYLGGEEVAGGKLKSTGAIERGDGLWYSPNKGATNSSGFSALPGGYRDSNGSFDRLRIYGYWQSSTESVSSDAWYRFLFCNRAGIARGYNGKGYGFSVRCVRDNLLFIRKFRKEINEIIF
jgi:uncharacterized protein (TIGR02145 family)